MKSLKTLKTGLTVATIAIAATWTANASACTYYIDEINAKNTLIAAAATNQKILIPELSSSQIIDFKWFESISTPMCPKELTYEGTVTLAYSDSASQKNCLVELKVIQVDDWEENTTNFSFDASETVCE